MEKGFYKEFSDCKPIVTPGNIKAEVGPYDYEEEWLNFSVQKIY